MHYDNCWYLNNCLQYAFKLIIYYIVGSVEQIITIVYTIIKVTRSTDYLVMKWFYLYFAYGIRVYIETIIFTIVFLI